jgi:NH3-dependent NAD+ synthetase
LAHPIDLKDAITLDLEETAIRLSSALREAVGKLRRRGLVVAISGGIDSACVAALAVRALGPKRVFGLMLPERDSSPESTRLGRDLANALGITFVVHDIAPMLTAAGCYAARDEAVRSVYPEFTGEERWKIVMHGDRLGTDVLNFFYVVIEPRGGGEERRIRLTADAYLQIVAATNFKQRCRKVMEYYHADRLVYAVAGTPNRLEYDQGFFVKLGDGAADVKPVSTRRRPTRSRVTSGSPRRFSTASRRPIRTASSSHSRTSTSPFTTRSSISSCGERIMACRHRRSPRSSGSRPNRSSVSTATSIRSGARRHTFTRSRSCSSRCPS